MSRREYVSIGANDFRAVSPLLNSVNGRMGRVYVPITSQTTSGLTRSKKGDASAVPKWLQRVSISVLVGAILLVSIEMQCCVDSGHVF